MTRPSAAPTAPADAGQAGRTRIASLDFVRGVAVLGILAINVAGFWGPTLATFSPRLPAATASPAADLWYAVAFVLFDGKMRALFTLLFGTSLLLFIEAAERSGRNGEWAQVRRLLWLATFGYLHYLLLWWGDILFPYALCGLAALALRRLSVPALVFIGLAVLVVPHGLDAVGDGMGIATEQRVLTGHGGAAELAEQAGMMQRIASGIAQDRLIAQAPFLTAVRLRLQTAPLLPFATTGATFTETFPLMLLGMALYRTGLWRGAWERRRLRRMAWLGIGFGGALTLAELGWMWVHGFPPRAMLALSGSLTALPHLAMALGYAAGLLLLWPRLALRPIGRALAAAGRCAFTNYLGTTVLMTALFSGWGLGLGATLPRGWLPLFVPLGWAAMLAWPQWWLARSAHGPLEGLWRRLTWLGLRGNAFRQSPADGHS